MLFFCIVILPLASAQYFSPIVPTNAYDPYSVMPPVMYGQSRRSPRVMSQPFYPGYINPINDISEPNGIGSDYAAYHQNSALLHKQQPIVLPMRSYYPNSEPVGLRHTDPQFQHNFQEEIPIQVIHGRPDEKSTQQAAPSSLSLPKFLEGANDEVIQQYKDIIRKPNSRYDEQVNELGKLVANLDEQRQLLYHQFMSENDKTEGEHRQKVHNYINQMSNPAQEQFAKISALLRNPTLTNEDRWGRVIALYEKLEPKLRDEFENKFKGFN